MEQSHIFPTVSQASLPGFFQELVAHNCLALSDIHQTRDGFFTVSRSIAQILACRGITTFPNAQGEERQCARFFDDWYLYALAQPEVWGLLKLREQESDQDSAIPSDGDTPGVTVSFIAFDIRVLAACLSEPTAGNRMALNQEINRVVAARGQSHHAAFKAYFSAPKAEAPYLIAECYIQKVASFARQGQLPVSRHYAKLYAAFRSGKASRKRRRIPAFLEGNNQNAGHTVCDHQTIFLPDAQNLTMPEKLAILATHTGNVSFHSFAAEVRYHACFLTAWAKLPIPLLGRSVYDSAIRADMTIEDKELEGPAPFYRLDSRWVKLQAACHSEYEF